MMLYKVYLLYTNAQAKGFARTATTRGKGNGAAVLKVRITYGSIKETRSSDLTWRDQGEWWSIRKKTNWLAPQALNLNLGGGT